MNLKQVERIREEYRDRALDESNPDRKIRDIWNTAVYISACYSVFKYKPIRNIGSAIDMFKKMRELKKLMKDENF